MKNRFYWVLVFCCLAPLTAFAQETQASSQASSQPASSQPASLPQASSLPASTPTSRADPWSGQEVKLPPTPSTNKSPRTAHMLAWFSFGGGLAMTVTGGSRFLATGAGDSRIPAITLIGLGGALSVFGPSFGHFYAGETKYAARRSLLTFAIVGGTTIASIAAYRLGSSLEDDPVRITIALVPLTLAVGYELQYAVQMAEDAPEAVKRSSKKRIDQVSLLPNGLALRF